MEVDTVGFKVVDSFNTFNEFEAALERFKSTKFVDVCVVTAGIETARRRGITIPLKVELRYHQLKYCCIHGGKAYRCRGKGSRST